MLFIFVCICNSDINVHGVINMIIIFKKKITDVVQFFKTYFCTCNILFFLIQSNFDILNLQYI